MQAMRKTVLGVTVDGYTLDQAVANARAAIAKRENQCVLACVNPHSVIEAQKDSHFLYALYDAEIKVPDGIGIYLVARLLGLSVPRRITGHDFFIAMMQSLEQQGGGRVAFLGSSPHVLSRIAARLKKDFPRVSLVATISPPFGEWSESKDAEMIESINRAQPDVLWVGMTAPKQEKWVAKNRMFLDVPLIGSIGAVFDYYAGTRQLAPAWVRRSGGEWLYRLAQDPKRLWRRTFVSTPQFVGLVVWRHLLGIGR